MTKLNASKLKEIKAEMTAKGFKYRQSNGIHNFLNAAILQGIEINGHDINPFCVGEETERIYGYDNVGNEVRDMIPIIEDILMEPANDPQDEAKAHEGEVISPGTPNPLEKTPDQAGETGLTIGVIPRYLTDELIKKHPGTIPALISMQRTDSSQVKDLVGYDGKPLKIKGKTVKYVDTAYMTVALNWATLMDWSFEVLDTKDYVIDKKHHFAALGCLTIQTTEGKTIMKQQWGSQVLKAKMEVGDALKAAASDSMKKCASMLGIAADVYGGVA